MKIRQRDLGSWQKVRSEQCASAQISYGHARIQVCGSEFLQPAPFSPDVAPSDFHLFPNMKKVPVQTHFVSNLDWIAAIENPLDSQEKN